MCPFALNPRGRRLPVFFLSGENLVSEQKVQEQEAVFRRRRQKLRLSETAETGFRFPFGPQR